MMNKHIEFVREWLDDPTSKTQAELEANADSSNDACINNPRSAGAVYAAWASDFAMMGAAEGAKDWIRRYEESTNA